MVLPPTRFDGRTYEALRRIWEGGGNKVSVASVARGDHVGRRHQRTGGHSIRAGQIVGLDAFAFIGCDDISQLVGDDSERRLVDDARLKVVASTGHAIILLALADVLKEKRATAPYEHADQTVRRGGRFTSMPLEMDGKGVTLRDPSVVEQFANAVIAATTWCDTSDRGRRPLGMEPHCR